MFRIRKGIFESAFFASKLQNTRLWKYWWFALCFGMCLFFYRKPILTKNSFACYTFCFQKDQGSSKAAELSDITFWNLPLNQYGRVRWPEKFFPKKLVVFQTIQLPFQMDYIHTKSLVRKPLAKRFLWSNPPYHHRGRNVWQVRKNMTRWLRVCPSSHEFWEVLIFFSSVKNVLMTTLLLRSWENADRINSINEI